jgi:hypothetical protein
VQELIPADINAQYAFCQWLRIPPPNTTPVDMWMRIHKQWHYEFPQLAYVGGGQSIYNKKYIQITLILHIDVAKVTDHYNDCCVIPAKLTNPQHFRVLCRHLFPVAQQTRLGLDCVVFEVSSRHLHVVMKVLSQTLDLNDLKTPVLWQLWSSNLSPIFFYSWGSMSNTVCANNFGII